MEISNKTLVALLVVSLVVSAVGIILGLNAGITGATTAEDTGKVNLTITTQTKLIFVNDTVFFGEGSVNESKDSCTMDTEGGLRATECEDFNNVTSGLSFRNDGNTNLSVQMNFTKNAASFLGGTGPHFQFKITAEYNRTYAGGQLDDTAESCRGFGADNLGGWTNTSTYHEVPGAGITFYICGNTTTYPLEPTNTKDDAVIDFNVTVPSNAPVGGKTVTVTVIGTSTE